MEKSLQIKCPAKINLSLDVVNRREDGYHNLRMIMQEIKLFDVLTFNIKASDSCEIVLSSEDSAMPTDESNLIYKAAKLFFEKTGITASARIHTRKNIPMGAGLGGGSTDAAGTLKALNTLFDEPMSKKDLAEIAKSLGADIPFFIYGGCMLAEGIGEILTPLPTLSGIYTVVAKPAVHVSTPWVYKNLVLSENTVHPDTSAVIKALETNNVKLLAESAGNVLETVTTTEYPIIEEYKTIMMNNGALYSLMSGSGSSVFGIFSDEASAKSAVDAFRTLTNDVYMA